jgi:hypothetical protein
MEDEMDEKDAERDDEDNSDSSLEGFIVKDGEAEEMFGSLESLEEEEEEEEPDGSAVETSSALEKDELDAKKAVLGMKRYSWKNGFYVYVQWVLSCVLEDSMVEVDKDYFGPAVRMMEDAVLSRKELMLRSSVWSEKFKKDLETYPDYRSWSRGSSLGRDCEACHRSNHPASHEVTLEGSFYDPACPIAALREGKETKPAVYRLGRFCHQRTFLFHQLHHWKYHLFQKIMVRLFGGISVVFFFLFVCFFCIQTQFPNSEKWIPTNSTRTPRRRTSCTPFSTTRC